MILIVNGAEGHMGRNVRECIRQKMPETVIVPVDAGGTESLRHLGEYDGRADCVIDFSHHSATKALLEYCTATGTPVVIATTGQTEEELRMIRDAGEKIPVFFTANLSIGIAVLVKMAKEAVKAFPDADVEIVEIHHNRKVDAPSGTALMLGKELQSVREGSTLHCGRSGFGKREKQEIGIQSLRMGNVVGIHEVHICTATQTLTLRHEAHDRKLFAEGALEAAQFLCGRTAGIYGMKDLLGEEEK